MIKKCLTRVKSKLSYELMRWKKRINLRRVAQSGVTIRSIDETISYLVEHRASIARFGDGEIDLITGKSIHFQTSSTVLSEKLAQVLAANGKYDRLMIAIPDLNNYERLFRPQARQFWQEYVSVNAGKWLNLLNTNTPYFNAHVTRLYMDWQDKTNSKRWYDSIKRLWDKRDIVLVEGEKSRLGVGNDLFAGAKSIRRILCPTLNAFDYYQWILEQVHKIEKDALLLLSLGPTATVLVYDLFLEGYQAVDVGHIDIEYSWFLTGAAEKQAVPGKYIAESKGGRYVADVQDPQYEVQIIARIDIGSEAKNGETL